MSAYAKLKSDMVKNDQTSYRNFMRMDKESFQLLLSKLEPLIVRKNTTMRLSVSPGERLAVTLRFLATGEHLVYIYTVYQKSIPPNHQR